jgi:hypothetical protein
LDSALIKKVAAKLQAAAVTKPNNLAALLQKSLTYKWESRAVAQAIVTRKIVAPLTKVFMKALLVMMQAHNLSLTVQLWQKIKQK